MTYYFNRGNNNISINWSQNDKDFFFNNGAEDPNKGFIEVYYGINEEPNTLLSTNPYTQNPILISLDNIPNTGGGYFVFTFKVRIYVLDATGGLRRWQWVVYGGLFIDKSGLHCTIVEKSKDNPDLLFYWIALSQDYQNCSCSYKYLIKIKEVLDGLLSHSPVEIKDCNCNG